MGLHVLNVKTQALNLADLDLPRYKTVVIMILPSSPQSVSSSGQGYLTEYLYKVCYHGVAVIQATAMALAPRSLLSPMWNTGA